VVLWSLLPNRVPSLLRQAVLRHAMALQLVVQVPLFALAMVKLVASSYSPFLYFQF